MQVNVFGPTGERFARPRPDAGHYVVAVAPNPSDPGTVDRRVCAGCRR